MAEYTPTTDTVRDRYIDPDEMRDEVLIEQGEEFERWLAQHDAEVAATALERLAADPHIATWQLYIEAAAADIRAGVSS